MPIVNYVLFFFLFWCPFVTIIVAFATESYCHRLRFSYRIVKVILITLVQAALFMPITIKLDVVSYIAPWWMMFLTKLDGTPHFSPKFMFFAAMYFFGIALVVEQYKHKRRLKSPLVSQI